MIRNASLPPTQAQRIMQGSLTYSLYLCHQSLATSFPAKVVGLVDRSRWLPHWPTDLWGDCG